MSTGCLFGIFVLTRSPSVIYRFLTDDLYEHLLQCFKKRGYVVRDDSVEDDPLESSDADPPLSVDDALAQHFFAILQMSENTVKRHDPIRRIKLDTGMQLYFDQIADNNVICMADRTFDTIVVLKTINLLKALIKFHIGALPFIPYNASDQLINRISASLQYFLDNINTNQALLFESCEHLNINYLIREQCREVCSMISSDVQNTIKVPRKIILITCNDKIVYTYISADQSRPNNADLFLLLLSNTSRLLRKQFELQKQKSSAMAHRYQRKMNHHAYVHSYSTRSSVEKPHLEATERANSCPNITTTPEMSRSYERVHRGHRSEVVFLKTSNKVIAPFTLFTIPLVNRTSVLVLVEWENSTACSNLFTLIRQLDSCATHSAFPYETLNRLIKAVESSAAVRRFFEGSGYAANILSDMLNQAHNLQRSSAKINGNNEQKELNGRSILHHLTDMSRLSSDAFRHLFFDSDEYARRCGVDIDQDQDSDIQMDGVGPQETSFRKNEYDTSPMTKSLRNKAIVKLEDWFSFIEVKSQRNITINFCQNDFPGLVHFVFVDRLRGQICSPMLMVDDPQHLTSNNPNHESEFILEKKILAFEFDCFSILQQGFTSYTISDEHFTYNYTLRLQESNGASMRLHKSFLQSHPPSVLHIDFYKALAEENYPWLIHQTTVACYELISVHLRIVPSNVVREQCDRLWPKLMEPFE